MMTHKQCDFCGAWIEDGTGGVIILPAVKGVLCRGYNGEGKDICVPCAREIWNLTEGVWPVPRQAIGRVESFPTPSPEPASSPELKPTKQNIEEKLHD
jgi:hypothetical protein